MPEHADKADNCAYCRKVVDEYAIYYRGLWFCDVTCKWDYIDHYDGRREDHNE